MKYALIGCGRIAINHLYAVKKTGLELVAICDIIPEKMDQILDKAELSQDSCEKYTDYKQMLDEHPEIELVSIATESGKHAKIALYCISKGIHCMIEKPIAMSLEDADKIIEESDKRGVKVAAIHQNRFNLAIQELKKALDQGRFGRLSHGSIHVRWNRNLNYYKQAPWRGTWAQDGGCLMNQCIHGIDLLRWIFGDDVVRVYGQTRQQFHDYLEAEDLGMALVEFKNGALATIEGTTNVYPKNLEESLYVFGEKGTVKIGGKSTTDIDVWEFEDERPEDKELVGKKEATSNVYGNGHSRIFQDMMEAIKEDRPPYVDARAGRRALELVLAIYKSMKTGQPVDLPLKNFSSLDMAGTFGEGTLNQSDNVLED